MSFRTFRLKESMEVEEVARKVGLEVTPGDDVLWHKAERGGIAGRIMKEQGKDVMGFFDDGDHCEKMLEIAEEITPPADGAD